MRFSLLIVLFIMFGSCKQKPSGFEQYEIDKKNKIKTIEESITINTPLKEQIFIYKEILKIDNYNLNALVNLGVISYELENYQNSVLYESKAIEIVKNTDNKQTHGHSLLIRGKSKFELEDYRGCIEDLKKAELLNTGYQDIYVYLGYAYLNLNQYENACKYFSISGEKGYSKAYELISEYCN